MKKLRFKIDLVSGKWLLLKIITVCGEGFGPGVGCTMDAPHQ